MYYYFLPVEPCAGALPIVYVLLATLAATCMFRWARN